MNQTIARIFRPLALAAGAITLASCATAEPAPEWAAEQQAVIDLLRDGPMGIETDFDAWESEFHDDWTVWFTGSPAPRAKVPHMASVRDYIGRGTKVVSYTAEFADIIIRGDTALARFNAVETLSESDGSPRVVRYASTDLLVRDANAWKILATTVALEPDKTEAAE